MSLQDKDLEILDLRSIENDVFEPAPATCPPISSIADHDYHQCLTINKTAILLNVHPATVRRMLKSGKLHGIKNGRLTRVFQWSLDQYLIENTTVPDSQDAIEPAHNKPKRQVKSTNHQTAMRRLERMGL